MKVTRLEMLYFHQQVKRLFLNPEIQKMGQYIQHGKTSCLEHCLTVSYHSYLTSIRLHLNIDATSLIRGALLHDFFLYDWHDKTSHPSFHGLKHPHIALCNAKKYFNLSPIEQDIISHHMWPLTPIPPHSIEGLLVCWIDKWCSLRETFYHPIQFKELAPYACYYTI